VNLSKLKPIIGSAINQRSVRSIITTIIEQVSTKLIDSKYLDELAPTLTEAGLQQLILDFKFYMEACSDYIPENIATSMNDCIDKCILLFCQKNEIDESEMDSVLKVKLSFLSKLTFEG
jgi:hypothetical protein